LEVVLSLPADTSSKNVQVLFKPERLDVIVAKESKLSLMLFERVDVDGCTWTIDSSSSDDEKKLVVTMEKIEEALWPRIRD
jgi:CS domain